MRGDRPLKHVPLTMRAAMNWRTDIPMRKNRMTSSVLS